MNNVLQRSQERCRYEQFTGLRQTPKTERLFSLAGTGVSGSTFWLELVRNTGLEVLNSGVPSGLIGSSLKGHLMEGTRNCGEQAVHWPKAA